MLQFIVDQKKVAAIPASLKEWTCEKGPRTLVREMELDQAADAAPALVSEDAAETYTLKGWAHHGVHSHMMAYGYC